MPSQDNKKTSICLDKQTRISLANIIKNSRAARTNVGVIRGVVYKYDQLLRWQVEAEARGNDLVIEEIVHGTGGAYRRQQADFRL